MQQWVAWIKVLGEKGRIKDPGRGLTRTGKLVTGKQQTITDGPYAEGDGLVRGYMVVEATDLREAAEFSHGCPIFDTGGFVEVRSVMET